MSLNDAKINFYENAGIARGPVDQMELAWLNLDVGVNSSNLSDAWRQFLNTKGFSNGTRQDDWYAYLGLQAHTGALQDRELQFYSNIVVDIDAPGNLQYTEPFSGFYLISWNAPPQPVDGYRIYRDGGLFGSTFLEIFVTLLPGVYRVQAFRGDLESPLSVPLVIP